MNKVFIYFSFFIFHFSFSQEAFKANCKFSNDQLFVLSDEAKDTIYVEVYFLNKIDSLFKKSHKISLSYRDKFQDNFSERLMLEIEDSMEIEDSKVEFIYNTIKDCLLEYQFYFYNKNLDEIMKLKKNKILIYNYRITITILPRFDFNQD